MEQFKAWLRQLALQCIQDRPGTSDDPRVDATVLAMERACELPLEFADIVEELGWERIGAMIGEEVFGAFDATPLN
jgi:hypothetical protein